MSDLEFHKSVARQSLRRREAGFDAASIIEKPVLKQADISFRITYLVSPCFLGLAVDLKFARSDRGAQARIPILPPLELVPGHRCSLAEEEGAERSLIAIKRSIDVVQKMKKETTIQDST